jgi:Trypsin
MSEFIDSIFNENTVFLGDSGGPLFSMKGGKQTQIGVVSWGESHFRIILLNERNELHRNMGNEMIMKSE